MSCTRRTSLSTNKKSMLTLASKAIIIITRVTSLNSSGPAESGRVSQGNDNELQKALKSASNCHPKALECYNMDDIN